MRIKQLLISNNSNFKEKRKESRIHWRNIGQWHSINRRDHPLCPRCTVFSRRFADLAFPADSRERVAYCGTRGACAAATRPGPMPAAPFRSVLVCAEGGSGRRSADRRRVVVAGSSIVRFPHACPIKRSLYDSAGNRQWPRVAANPRGILRFHRDGRSVRPLWR